MTTLTVTQARQNLSGWLRRAKAGEEIGIIDGADIYALRPVSVTATDVALAEYGATPAEVKAAVARARADIAAARRLGELEEISFAPHPANQARRRPSRRSSR